MRPPRGRSAPPTRSRAASRAAKPWRPQAASAFTYAFKLALWISVGIALAAAAVILVVWRRQPEPVTEDIEKDIAQVGVNLARVAVRPCP